MKKVTMKRIVGVIMALALALASIPLIETEAAGASVPVYRLYNGNTGEHFYTLSSGESDHLQDVGWSYEGIGWYSPKTGKPIYRVYNPNAQGGDHYYTASKGEANHLVSLGWRWDNNGKPVFYSGGKVNLYVEYNPNAQSGSHNYTTSKNEHNHLLSIGWQFGAVAWKVSKVGVAVSYKARTKADENVTDVGGGEASNPGSYRWIYSDLSFTPETAKGKKPDVEFSCNVNIKEKKNKSGFQFVIAGNGHGSGQIGINMYYHEGNDARFAQGRLSISTINFPAGSGTTGQQYYAVNTGARASFNQTNKIVVKYYKSAKLVETYLNGKLIGRYNTRLTTPDAYILHFNSSLRATVTNVKVKRNGRDVTTNRNVSTVPFDKKTYELTNSNPISGAYY